MTGIYLVQGTRGNYFCEHVGMSYISVLEMLKGDS